MELFKKGDGKISVSYILYKHTFPNGKVYYGITKQGAEKRWRSGKGYDENQVVRKAIDKYGWDNIKHEVIMDGLTCEEAQEEEIKAIASEGIENTYNCTLGGGGVRTGTYYEGETYWFMKRFVQPLRTKYEPIDYVVGQIEKDLQLCKLLNAAINVADKHISKDMYERERQVGMAGLIYVTNLMIGKSEEETDAEFVRDVKEGYAWRLDEMF